MKYTVILLADDGDGQRQMYMDSTEAENSVEAVEIVRDRIMEPGTGWEDATVTDIITIPGEHVATGPSQPWW